MDLKEVDQEEFYYPTGFGVLRSVEEYQKHYLPELLDPKVIDPRLKCCLQMVEREVGEAGEWLDYGCGGGVFVHHLAKRLTEWGVQGWDGDFSSIEIANGCFSRPNTRFELRPYTAYTDMQPDSVDGISFLEVVEHVDNPGDILRGFHSALRQGGYLLVSTPNFLGWSALNLEFRRIINELIGRRKRDGYIKLLNEREYNPATESGHISLYSAPTLTMLLQSRGFDVVDFQLVPSSKKVKHRLFPDTLIVLAKKNG